MLVTVTVSVMAIFAFGQAQDSAPAETTPSSPPTVDALFTNLTTHVDGEAWLPFTYQLPEGISVADVRKAVYHVYRLQGGRNDVGAIENGITRYYGEYEGRVRFQVEEGILTVMLTNIQHSDQGWYELEIRVAGSLPVLAKGYLTVVDAPVCPALNCLNSRSICTVEGFSTGSEPYNPPNCTCECAYTSNFKPGSEVTVPGVLVGMFLLGILLAIVVIVLVMKGWGIRRSV
uniref:Uncharacterized protein n=1 Tax=Branchiostoma floridae TaxID=7739 RepID=C3ZBN1_BRAFL|eukprot:XP_002594257.1 hypothetical protein BRAFLDRAFT_117648 [Branchiostoma floridae]